MVQQYNNAPGRYELVHLFAYGCYCCIELIILSGYIYWCSRFVLLLSDRNRHVPVRNLRLFSWLIHLSFTKYHFLNSRSNARSIPSLHHLCICAALRAAANNEGPCTGASNNAWKIDGTPVTELVLVFQLAYRRSVRLNLSAGLSARIYSIFFSQ